MDRTNAWCRRTILCFVLLWPLQANAASLEVGTLAAEAARHADQTKIIIVGEDHKNERLADELLELLTLLRAADDFDCLFVEYPSDLQDEFDRAVNEADIGRLVRASLLVEKSTFLTASGQLGYKSNNIVSVWDKFIRQAVERAKKGIRDPQPVNSDLLTYLRQNEISLLSYDAASGSKEIVEIETFQLRVEFANTVRGAFPAPDDDMFAALVENTDARNLIMAQNIVSRFASRRCSKGLVVVGSRHFESKELQESRHLILGIPVNTFTPLQDRLQEQGLPSAVVGKLHAPYSANSGRIIPPLRLRELPSASHVEAPPDATSPLS